MPVVYPSPEWLEELKRKVNSDEEYKRVAANWEGDYLVITEIDEEALKDFQNPKILAGYLRMVAMLPPEKRAKFKGTPGEVFMNKLGASLGDDLDVSKLNIEEMAKKIAEINLEEVRGAATYLWMDFWHGELRNLEVVGPGEHEDAKFKLRGPYSSFKEMVMGKADPTSLVMRGKLKLEGDLAYMMRNMAAVKRYSELQASIDIDTDP